jgi:hypothetical protein
MLQVQGCEWPWNPYILFCCGLSMRARFAASLDGNPMALASLGVYRLSIYPTSSILSGQSWGLLACMRPALAGLRPHPLESAATAARWESSSATFRLGCRHPDLGPWPRPYHFFALTLSTRAASVCLPRCPGCMRLALDHRPGP